MRQDQALELCSGCLPVARRTRDLAILGRVRAHRNTYAAERHDAFGDLVHELGLLSLMLVEQQVKLPEGGAGALLVMLLVQVSQNDGVGENAVEIDHARLSRLVGERDLDRLQIAEPLDFLA